MATPQIQTAEPHGQGPEGLADDVAIVVRRPGDTANRWELHGDGSVWKGNGTGAPAAQAITSNSSGETFADGANIAFGTTTGTQIGTVGGAAGQKIGFWGATPVVQPVFATGASHTVDQLITVLQTLGLLRQS